MSREEMQMDMNNNGPYPFSPNKIPQIHRLYFIAELKLWVGVIVIKKIFVWSMSLAGY